MRRYAIPDEPAPSRYTHLVVTPFATLLGVMLGGSLVGLPWMAVNGWAMGSATWKKEAAIAVGALIGQFVLVALVVALLGSGIVPREAGPYLAIGIQAFRLAAAYWAHLLQSASFELYLHFGGRVARGGWMIAVGLLVLRLWLISSSELGPFAAVVGL